MILKIMVGIGQLCLMVDIRDWWLMCSYGGYWWIISGWEPLWTAGRSSRHDWLITTTLVNGTTRNHSAGLAAKQSEQSEDRNVKKSEGHKSKYSELAKWAHKFWQVLGWFAASQICRDKNLAKYVGHAKLCLEFMSLLLCSAPLLSSSWLVTQEGRANCPRWGPTHMATWYFHKRFHVRGSLPWVVCFISLLVYIYI